MPRWGWRIVHYSLAVLATVSAVLGLVLAELGYQLYLIEYYTTSQLTVAIAFGWAGAILLRYPKARYVARLLLACAVADGCGMLLTGIGSYAITSYSAGALLSQIGDLLAFSAVTAGLVLLPQAFPDGPMRRRPWLVIFRAATTLAILAPLGLLVTTLLYGGYDPVSEVAYWAFIAFIVIGMFVGAASLVVRWRTAPPPARRQVGLYTLLNLLALVALVAMFLSTLTESNQWSDVFFILWPVAVVVVIVVTVLRAQLYDIRIVVRRAAIYAFLALLVAVLFVSVYFIALVLISEYLDRVEYRWVALAVAAAAVVALEPVRRRLRDRLEQRVLGDRGDPLRALDRLQRRMTSDNPEAVAVGMVEAVAAAVRSPAVTLRVQRDGSIEQIAVTGDPQPDALTMPLIHAGERLGELQVGPRTPGEPFSPADTKLLQRMAHESAAVVYAQRRDSELAGARRQAVDAVLDERSRLGRDLHDDLAPLLAGASLSVEALRRGIPAGTAEEHEAARLAVLLRDTATHTRRLAYDLQPPEALADFRGALQAHLETLAGRHRPCFDLRVDFDAVPQSVRHTAYRVALEAVNNVVTHARADNARVSVTTDAGVLRLEVRDDGVGLDQPYTSGIGINSMRRRVESIGGTFAIKPIQPHGTLVSATIPLELDS